MHLIPTDTSLRFYEIDADKLDAIPDAIADIMAKRYTGFIIKGWLTPEECAHGIDRLRSDETPIPRMSNPHFAGWSHGPGVVNARDGMDPYLTKAAGLREGFASAFGFDVVQRFTDLFSKLSGGRQVQTVSATDGRPYSPVTARALSHTGGLPIHCGNETHSWPSMKHISTFIDTTDQLSFFVTLQPPDAGGEMVVYDVQHTVPSDPVMSTMSGPEVSPEIEARGFLNLRPGVGDVILFDGGRYFHRVVAVNGEKQRWTMGGFMAKDATQPTVWYWS